MTVPVGDARTVGRVKGLLLGREGCVVGVERLGRRQTTSPPMTFNATA